MWAVLAVVAAACAGIVTLTVMGDPDEADVPRPAVTSTMLAQDHVDDYSAPVSELIDHVDHLDLDRLPATTRAQLEAELARRDALAEGLWAAYGDLVSGDPQADPALVRGLPLYELAYVLTAARAEHLAAAIARTGSLAAARSESRDHRDVTVRMSGDCVTVAYTKDPFDRSFGARAGAVGEGPLRDRLARAVRVAAAGDPACGGAPLVLSPDAVVALGG